MMKHNHSGSPFLSVVVATSLTKYNLGEEGLFQRMLLSHCPPLREVKTGTQAETIQRCYYWLACTLVVSKLSPGLPSWVWC